MGIILEGGLMGTPLRQRRTEQYNLVVICFFEMAAMALVALTAALLGNPL